MKNIIIVIACWLIVQSAYLNAQTASFAADNPQLAPSGGAVVVSAAVAYDGQPGALGVAVDLPKGWTLLGVSGENVPAIAPEPGSAGTLEFAFTEVPANGVRFSVTVRYPERAASAVVTSTVLVRSNGKLATVRPAAIAFRGGDATGEAAQK